jgi:hypothetical protein
MEMMKMLTAERKERREMMRQSAQQSTAVTTLALNVMADVASTSKKRKRYAQPDNIQKNNKLRISYQLQIARWLATAGGSKKKLIEDMVNVAPAESRQGAELRLLNSNREDVDFPNNDIVEQLMVLEDTMF